MSTTQHVSLYFFSSQWRFCTFPYYFIVFVTTSVHRYQQTMSVWPCHNNVPRSRLTVSVVVVMMVMMVMVMVMMVVVMLMLMMMVMFREVFVWFFRDSTLNPVKYKQSTLNCCYPHLRKSINSEKFFKCKDWQKTNFYLFILK